MADMIANVRRMTYFSPWVTDCFKGAIFALAVCSNGTAMTTIPQRVGRIDATKAGPFGVPEAHTVRSLFYSYNYKSQSTNSWVIRI